MSLNELRLRHPHAQAFKFGDSEDLSERLIALVRCGKKTASCGALRDYDNGDEEIPVVGRRDIALHWDDTPALVIETIEVTTKRFCDVDEAFALAEGENDDHDGWRRDHQAYFERNGGFERTMLVVCERFRLVEVISDGSMTVASVR